ncbi:ferrous iron transporter FeoB [Thermanaeromonas toyohensis ToBE]|uniref:Ferrous iron transport protein B n=1 Tax=Thermanaeromonas toyohensis ToBE TaxID=698762 RepID=A0A1W1W2R0_9FIRM|nr:ferrous iron transport protein B [Thermanaeromonas toyohensis]SMB99897.1 ferrous iron transporter FeoB [Thermanaeromonas toyohensis ToBE]
MGLKKFVPLPWKKPTHTLPLTNEPPPVVVALVGNPNTGKSTLFNALTGLRQHTGNWPGKTVSLGQGIYRYKDRQFMLIDLPGTYSLQPGSPEEEITHDFLLGGTPRVVVVVADATALERSLLLTLQVINLGKVVLCINLIDEAKKRGLEIDTSVLSRELGIPVVATVARSGQGLTELREAIYNLTSDFRTSNTEVCSLAQQNRGCLIGGKLTLSSCPERKLGQLEDITTLYRQAESLVQKAMIKKSGEGAFARDRWLDDIITSKWIGLPLMVLLLGAVFWITLIGANYPSELLTKLFSNLEQKLILATDYLSLPLWLRGLVVEGVYQTTAWVVSVMLPPMAIFFPCFTFLEELGYLPRVAFTLDGLFKLVGTCGKQALTMGMGFGCNAAGVTACRIIDSPRERLIAMLTNVFVPCNGRFPLLISLASIFFAGTSGNSLVAAAAVTGLVLFGILITLAVSWILSRTLLHGVPSAFALELPPFRWPRIGSLLIRSFLDRTIFVLGRAVTVAAPAGALTWLLANTHIAEQSLLNLAAGYLQPLARSLGLDGYILLAFILALPANELVLPLLLMAYLNLGTLVELDSLEALATLLKSYGWTWTTALSVTLFSLLHYPCATTLLSIYKETRSLKWTILAFTIPLSIALVVLLLLNVVLKLF